MHGFFAVCGCSVHLLDSVGEILCVPLILCARLKFHLRELDQSGDVVLVGDGMHVHVEEHRGRLRILVIASGVLVVAGIQIAQHLVHDALVVVRQIDETALALLIEGVREVEIWAAALLTLN